MEHWGRGNLTLRSLRYANWIAIRMGPSRKRSCGQIRGVEEVRVPGGSPRSGGRGIAAPTWSEIDQDGDGKVSLKEAPERMKGRFDRMDQNGDGFLDKEEQERIDQMFRRMRGGGGQSPEGRGRGRSPRGGGSGSEDVWKILAEKYDKDRNGEISKEEYTRGGEKFTQLDRNEDGKLNEADFLGGRNRGGGRGGRGRGPGRDAGAGARSGIP